MKRSTIALFTLIMFLPGVSSAQVLGMWTTAAISSEGEGGLFASGGKDGLRLGAMARFLVTERSDLGVQIGMERRCENNIYGAAIDLKYDIISSESSVPVDLALEGTYGYFLSGDYSRHVLGIGVLVSGILKDYVDWRIEPYGSLSLFTHRFGKTPSIESLENEADRTCWPYSEDSWDSINDTVVRGGVKFPIKVDYEIYLEIEIGDDTFFGGSFSVIF